MLEQIKEGRMDTSTNFYNNIIYFHFNENSKRFETLFYIQQKDKQNDKLVK